MKVISEKAYLAIFSALLTTIIAILLGWYIPRGYIEYNLGISLVTSLASTVLTVIFLSLFLTVREEREWRDVKNAVYSMISMQSGLLFGELLRFVESELDEVGFKFSLSSTKDAKIRKKMIFSKLSELHSRKPFQLTSSYVSAFWAGKELLAPLLDVKRDLEDIQIKYALNLTSRITERLIRIQDFLELLNLNYELNLRWNRLQTQSSLFADLVEKVASEGVPGQSFASVDPFKDALTESIKGLIDEVYEMWEIGIEFDFAP